MYKDDNNSKFINDKLKNSNILIGHIRATKHHFDDDVCYNNTHPFWYKEQYWLHNGSAYPLETDFFKKYIDSKFLEHIKGKTDSELLFYIFLTILDKIKNIDKAWENFFKLLNRFSSENNISISANIIYCNKDIIYVSRAINNDEIAPSLYFDENLNIISSEPVSDKYHLLKNNSYIKYVISTKNIEII